MPWTAAVGRFLAAHWGDLANVLGLILSLISALYAKKATRAGEAAKVAADAARREARRRNLAEELQDALRHGEQMGLLMREAMWDVVYVRAQDVTRACGVLLKRWPADLAA
jgi:hypothetical protein